MLAGTKHTTVKPLCKTLACRRSLSSTAPLAPCVWVSAEWKRKEHASKQSVSSEATGTWHKLDTACGNTHEQLNVIGLQLTCTWPMCCSNATKEVRSTSIDHECMQSRCSRPSIQL